MRTSKQPSNKKKEKRTIAIDWQEKEMIECRKNWLILYQRRRKHGCNAEPGLEESFFPFYFISYNFFIVRYKVLNKKIFLIFFRFFVSFLGLNSLLYSINFHNEKVQPLQKNSKPGTAMGTFRESNNNIF